MIGVIATVFGLAVVALQLSSTQFSPRLVRNFLRDGVTQWVLAVFVGTFAYAAAGLYTVGARRRRADRAVPAARGERRHAAAVRQRRGGHRVRRPPGPLAPDRLDPRRVDARDAAGDRGSPAEGTDERAAGPAPDHAVPVPATRSGYLQILTPGHLLRYVGGAGPHRRAGPAARRLRRGRNAGGPLLVDRPGPERLPDGRPRSHRSSRPPSTSGSSGRCSRTSGSGSGSWSTPRARRSPRRSTTPTRPSRRSITSRTSSSPLAATHLGPRW